MSEQCAKEKQVSVLIEKNCPRAIVTNRQRLALSKAIVMLYETETAQLRRSLDMAEEGLEISQELNATLRERFDQAEAIVRKLTGMSVSEYERKEGEEKKKQ